MSFIKKTADIDFGQTLIENIFINDFMPMANGTHVKVYLLGFKYANDNEINHKVSNQTIARHLGIPLSDVLDAWDFWEQKSIIKKHKKEHLDESVDYDYTVEFLSLRQLYIDNNYTQKSTVSQTPPQDVESSVNSLISANKIPEVKDMFYNIQQLMCRPLSTNERFKIMDWMTDYGVTPDVVLRAFEYSINQRGVKNLSYVAAIIRSWYDKGIITIAQIDEELAKSDKRFMSYIKILKFLGLSTSNIGDNSKNIINKWIDDWGFDLDIILKACERTSNISNPNLNYIDKILKDWHANSIKTIDDVNSRLTARKETTKPNTPTNKSIQPKKNNRFHNFEQKYHKLSNDDFERFMSNKKNK